MIYKKKRVLVVHNFYQIGGGEHTVFRNEVNLLKNNGHDVFIYTRSNDELKENKYRLLFLPFEMIWSFKTYIDVKRIIQENGIEVVHCHNTFPLISPSVYYAALKKGVPVVQTVHNYRFLCPGGLCYRKNKICEECIDKKYFFDALKNKCYRNSRLQTLAVIIMLTVHRLLRTYKKINYIFLSETNKKKFENLIGNGKNVFIKPNFVHENTFFSNREIKNKVFVFIGRLEENKGIRFLLEAWEKVDREYELHIYGDGEYKSLIEEKATNNSNIKYFGFKDHKEIFEDLRSSLGLIMCSELNETFGMTVAEGFSCGTPAIVSSVGNPKEMIEKSGGGVVYELKNIDSFVSNIERLIRYNDLFSKNALNYYKKELNSQRNYEILTNIYDSLI